MRTGRRLGATIGLTALRLASITVVASAPSAIAATAPPARGATGRPSCAIARWVTSRSRPRTTRWRRRPTGSGRRTSGARSQAQLETASGRSRSTPTWARRAGAACTPTSRARWAPGRRAARARWCARPSCSTAGSVRRRRERRTTCTSATCSASSARCACSTRWPSGVRTFLDEHPREVLVIVIEDYVRRSASSTVLADAGLASSCSRSTRARRSRRSGQMIDAGTRLLGVARERRRRPRRCPTRSAALVEETPFTFRSTARSASVRRRARSNRGAGAAPVFQFNHWVTPAEPVDRTDAVNYLRPARAHRRVRRASADARRRSSPSTSPRQGDLLEVVERLNRGDG